MPYRLDLVDCQRRRHRARPASPPHPHHSPAIDLKVLSMLAEGKYAVDCAAPTTPLQRLKTQIEAYRVDDVER
jgi:hypothetical protein